MAIVLGRLTLLTNLSLGQAWSFSNDCTYDTNHAGDIIGHLTGLQILALRCVVDQIPAAFSNLQHLCTLTISGNGEEWPNFAVQPSFSSRRKLQSLFLLEHFSAVTEADWLNACIALSALPSLSSILMSMVDLNDLQAQEWAFGSRLTHLRISESCSEDFPEALVSLTSLRCLGFNMTSLEDLPELPAGPYLQHLTSLDLCDTKLPAFPEALSQASKLRQFTSFDDEPWLGLDKLKAILPSCCEVDFIEGGSDEDAANDTEAHGAEAS